MSHAKKQFRLILALTFLMLAWSGVSPAAAQVNLDKILDKKWGDYTWGAYGASRESSKLGREEIVARENYCPSTGCVLRLDGVAIKPARAHKGSTLTLAASYTILTPEGVAIPVAVSREILFQGKSLGRTKNIDSRQVNGSWTQEVDFTLPADAVPGDYTLKTRVSTGYGLQEKEVQFRVD